MRIALHHASIGEADRWVDAEPSAFPIGAKVTVGGAGFVVEKQRVVIGKAGEAHLALTLRPDRKWFEPIDEFNARDNKLPAFLAVVFLLLIGAPFVVLFWFLSLDEAARTAWAGYLIAWAPWLLGLGLMIASAVLAVRLYPHVGETVSVAIAIAGVLLAVGLSVWWWLMFLQEYEPAWPDGYAALARKFSASTAAITAVVAAYVPLLIAFVKLLKIEWLTFAISFLKKDKGAA